MPEQTQVESKPRTLSMKWVQLGLGKDPEFMKTVFLCGIDGTEEDFESGWLKTIEIEKGTKVFKFVTGFENGAEEIRTDFTHYCTPTSPYKS